MHRVRFGASLLGLTLAAALGVRICARARPLEPATDGFQFLGLPGEPPLRGELAWEAVQAAIADAPLPGGVCLAFEPRAVGLPGLSARTHRLEVRAAPGQLLGLRLKSDQHELALEAPAGTDQLECSFEVPLVGTRPFTLEVETTRGWLAPWKFELAGPLTLGPGFGPTARGHFSGS